MTQKLHIAGYDFVRTCTAAPEQYDVYKDGEYFLYFRVRYGHFTVQTDCLGEYVYSSYIRGWENFLDDERGYFLVEGLKSGIEYYKNKDS